MLNYIIIIVFILVLIKYSKTYKTTFENFYPIIDRDKLFLLGTFISFLKHKSTIKKTVI